MVLEYAQTSSFSLSFFLHAGNAPDAHAHAPTQLLSALLADRFLTHVLAGHLGVAGPELMRQDTSPWAIGAGPVPSAPSSSILSASNSLARRWGEGYAWDQTDMGRWGKNSISAAAWVCFVWLFRFHCAPPALLLLLSLTPNMWRNSVADGALYHKNFQKAQSLLLLINTL